MATPFVIGRSADGDEVGSGDGLGVGDGLGEGDVVGADVGTVSTCVVFVIVIVCVDASHSTSNLKLSDMKRMGSIVLSFIMTGAVSRVCGVPFKYAVTLSIVSSITSLPYVRVAVLVSPFHSISFLRALQLRLLREAVSCHFQ